MAKERDEQELAQLRGEVALLRAQVQQQQERQAETDADKAAHAAFIEYTAKSAQEKTQIVADRMFPRTPTDSMWVIELKEQPRITLPAHSEFEAVGRYNQLCGIIGTAHTHSITRLADQ